MTYLWILESFLEVNIGLARSWSPGHRPISAIYIPEASFREYGSGYTMLCIGHIVSMAW